MATRTYQTPVGTNLESITLVAGHIAGIGIDNPSGSWLLVTGIQQYVPPYRLGWSFPVSPQQTSLSVRFVDSPSGSLSVLVGDPVRVTLSDTPVQVGEGFPSGAGARVTIVPPFQTAALALLADIPNGPQAVPQPVLVAITRPIVLRRISFTYDLRDLGAGAAGYDPRSIVAGYWAETLGLTFDWQQLISPETPYVTEEIADGAVIMPINSVLTLAGIVQVSGAEYVLGISDIQVFGQVQYYELAQ